MPGKPTNGELAILISSLTDEMRAANGRLIEGTGRLEEKMSSMNGRVRRLEQWKYAMIGGMILGNLLLVPVVISWITKHIP